METEWSKEESLSDLSELKSQGSFNDRELKEVKNKTYDVRAELSNSFSDESIETNETRSPKNKTSIIQDLSPQRTLQKINETDHSNLYEVSKKSTFATNSKLDISQRTSPKQLDGFKDIADDIEFQHVPDDIRNIIKEKYKPHHIQLMTKLKCFLPEYIPALGEMNHFLTFERPDRKNLGLGTIILDEPNLVQSDPNVVELKLRAESKTVVNKKHSLSWIRTPSEEKDQITKWINDVNEVHKAQNKWQSNDQRDKSIIEDLLSLWPEKLESKFQTISISTFFSPNLNLSLSEYIRFALTILNVQIEQSLDRISYIHIKALYLTFCAYLELTRHEIYQG